MGIPHGLWDLVPFESLMAVVINNQLLILKLLGPSLEGIPSCRVHNNPPSSKIDPSPQPNGGLDEESSPKTIYIHLRRSSIISIIYSSSLFRVYVKISQKKITQKTASCRSQSNPPHHGWSTGGKLHWASLTIRSTRANWKITRAITSDLRGVSWRIEDDRGIISNTLTQLTHRFKCDWVEHKNP